MVKMCAELNASGEVMLTFAEPQVSLTDRLCFLMSLKVAALHALEADKASAEAAWQQVAQS